MNGLREVQMRRLGNVVVLVGPNGAGKMRILHLLTAAHQARGAARQRLQQLKRQVVAAKGLKMQIAESAQKQYNEYDTAMRWCASLEIDSIGAGPGAGAMLQYVPPGNETQSYLNVAMGQIGRDDVPGLRRPRSRGRAGWASDVDA